MVLRCGAIVAAMLAWSTPAAAEPLPQGAAFDVAMLSDTMLDAVRGTAAPFARQTRADVVAATNTQSRADFELVGSVTRMQMDVWWGGTGSVLIAEAVRAEP